uniref:TRAP transporter small permease n=1 Tax=Roseihalotalea indica TaxID=2867963 RepID=A0AA49JIQ1_9BACT|nr:TRAP transporter small permease [Tunicatimonas sp. TK19036]
MKFKPYLDRFLERVLISIMALMVVNVLWQVASRYLMQSPSSFTDELSRYLLIWLSLLGASYVTGKKMHLSIDLLMQNINTRRQKTLNTVIYSLVALFAFLAMVVGGIRLLYIVFSLGQTSPALEIPMGIVYLVLPISGLTIIYYSILNIIQPHQPDDSSIGHALD